jgi:hypothetical protein
VEHAARARPPTLDSRYTDATYQWHDLEVDPGWATSVTRDALRKSAELADRVAGVGVAGELGEDARARGYTAFRAQAALGRVAALARANDAIAAETTVGIRARIHSRRTAAITVARIANRMLRATRVAAFTHALVLDTALTA